MEAPPLKKYTAEEIIPDDLSVRSMLDTLRLVRPSTWSMYNRSIKGAPYTFDVHGLIDKLPKDASKRDRLQLYLRHRPFLVQPLNDMHPHKVYKKARQVGVSELSLTEVLYFLEANPTTKWVYTFPREKQLTDFSTTRITEVMEESPRMKRLFGTPNQTFLKKIGTSSFLLLRSAWESSLGEGIDADGVTFDEKDRMKEGIEVAFRESLSSSKFGLMREVSTPTLPGRGVDASFLHSDQMEWHVACEKCGMWQTIEYPENIIQLKEIGAGAKELEEGTYEFQCRKEKCRGNLDRVHGYWVPKYPSRVNIRGYLIPQSICPWISATQLMQKKIDYKFQQLWENYCLGRTSVGENVLLSEEAFENATSGHEMVGARTADWDQITVGIDWGYLNWVIVIGRNVHNGKKYLLNIGVFEDDMKQELQSVKRVDEFIAPFAPDIIVADAGYGKDRNLYLLRKYPGKLFACLAGDTKVATLDEKGWKRIKNVKVGDYTYAWDGEKYAPTKVTHVHSNGIRKTVIVTVKDGNGRQKTITCTPDHRFPLRLGGEKHAFELKAGDRLVPFGRWETKNGKYRAIDPFNLGKNEGKKLIYEHRWVQPDSNVVHHIDHNGLNNVPTNLLGVVSAKAHREAHPIKMPPQWVEKLIERNRKFADSEGRVKNFANHVVVSVEEGPTIPVYDLTVEHDAHNFALHDSVFVHNCWYNPSEKGSRTFIPSWQDAFSKVLVDRTMTLKNTCRILKECELGLPRFDRAMAMFKKHFENLAPMREEEDGEIFETISSTGDDHLAHAAGYALLGMEKLEGGRSSFSFDFVGG